MTGTIESVTNDGTTIAIQFPVADTNGNIVITGNVALVAPSFISQETLDACLDAVKAFIDGVEAAMALNVPPTPSDLQTLVGQSVTA